MALCQIHTHLRNQRIGECKLSERKSSDGKLSDAKYTKPKLRNADNAAGELTNGDYPACHNGCSIRPELERNMQKRQTTHCQLGFVLVAPSIPRVARRIGRPAVRTGERL